MPGEILHIYGPLSINAYGLMIAIGVSLAIFFLFRDKKCQALISEETLSNAIIGTIITGVLGGRLLWYAEQAAAIQSSIPFFALWQGGLSSLGAMIAVTLFVPLYLYFHGIPVLQLLDRVVLYFPLAPAFGRLGCFFAGCCYGMTTTLPWAITYYTEPSFAPLGIPLHPTQLYSAAVQFLLFLFLWKLKDKDFRPGTLVGIYLLSTASSRFVIDFLRANRRLVTGCLSFTQYVALGIMLMSALFLTAVWNANSFRKKSF